jgi:hypothetical protein
MSTRALELIAYTAFITPLLILGFLLFMYWLERLVDDRALRYAREVWSSAIAGESSPDADVVRLLPPGPYDVVQRGEL